MTVHRTQPDAPLFIRPVDPAVRDQDRDDFTGQNAIVFARLLQGPATRTELERLTGGRRIGARVNDINRHFGETKDRRSVVGRWLEGPEYEYRLTGGDQ